MAPDVAGWITAGEGFSVDGLPNVLGCEGTDGCPNVGFCVRPDG